MKFSQIINRENSSWREQQKLNQMQYRFMIKKVKGPGEPFYRLMVGLSGYLEKDFQPLETCAYVNELPIRQFEFVDGIKAQQNISTVRHWFEKHHERYEEIRKKIRKIL